MVPSGRSTVLRASPIQHFAGVAQFRHAGLRNPSLAIDRSGIAIQDRPAQDGSACPLSNRSPSRRTSPSTPSPPAKPGAPLVLLLHGFAESMHCWRAQVTALAATGLSRGRAEPARLFAGRAAGPARHRELSHRPADGRCDGDRGGVRLWRARAFISPATTGAAASPGRSPTAFRSGWPRSRCCRGRIRTPSTARCRCPTASRRSARGITRRFSSPTPPMSCWPTTRNGCASGSAANGVPAAAIERASCRARQQGRDGSGAGLVSRPRRDPRAARPDPGADALHLGRCRRHRRPGRRRGHGGFRRRALSLRGAARRRPFCGRSGAGAGQRIDAGARGGHPV